VYFFFQAEDGIRDGHVTGVQTCALPISSSGAVAQWLNTPQPMRSIGAIYSGDTPDAYFGLVSPHSFDVIFFVERTTAAHENPKHSEIELRGGPSREYGRPAHGGGHQVKRSVLTLASMLHPMHAAKASERIGSAW